MSSDVSELRFALLPLVRLAPANDTRPMSLLELLRRLPRPPVDASGDPDVEGAMREARRP